jgi:nucleoside-diphosphate-sugar epimerase
MSAIADLPPEGGSHGSVADGGSHGSVADGGSQRSAARTPVASGFSRKKIFVAGGAGMAGTAIVEALLRIHPEARVRASWRHTPPAVHDPRVEHVHLDLADPHALREALDGCEATILAASESGGIRMLAEQPWRQVTPNLLLAARWLEAAHHVGIRRALFIGSATCYQPLTGAIREDDLDLNIDPAPEAFGVGWTMRSAEKLCEFWARAADIEIVRVRAANIYGPRARFDPARSNFIPALVRKVADGMSPLDVWGTPDVTRDVIYSADFGEAIARLLVAPGAAGRVFNVGTGRPVQVGEVVKALLRAADTPDVQVVYADAGPSSSPCRVLDCNRLTTELGWAPPTSLEAGLGATLRWWRANRTTWQR